MNTRITEMENNLTKKERSLKEVYDVINEIDKGLFEEGINVKIFHKVKNLK